MVDQRGDNSSNTGNAFGGPDRWYWLGGADATCNTRQGGATDLAGFPRQYKVSVGTADTSISAGNYVVLRQLIEGRNVQAIQKGFSSAKQLTLSFWLRMTNATGVYTCELRDSDNNRHCCKQFTVSDGNWNKYTLTFPADTTGKLTDDNTASLEVQFWLTAGTDYTSGTLQTTWATFNSANPNRAAGQTGNFVGSTSNVLEITGVQLEVGDTATEYEHRSYGDELARCQRYYFMESGDYGVWMNPGMAQDSTDMYFFVNFPVPMRSNPSYTAEDVNIRLYGADASDAFGAHGLAVIHQNTTAASGGGCTSSWLYKSGTSITAGQAGVMQAMADGVKLQFSAEL